MKLGEIHLKKFLKSSTKKIILMIGPSSPPYGGVATVIKNLTGYMTLNKKYQVQLYRTGRTCQSTVPIQQFVKDTYHLLKFFFSFRFRHVDIFHIHTSSFWSFIRNVPYVFIGKYLFKGKIVMQIHGGAFQFFYTSASWPMKKIIKYSLELSNCIIVSSSSWEKILKDIVANKCIKIISNGYDEHNFKPMSKKEARTLLSLPRNKTILLSIGSLEKYKGQKFLIASIREIITDKVDLIAYIIGSGKIKKSLEGAIKKDHLEKYLILLEGSKTPKEVALWINACDIFVLPSLIENSPIVMFESLACGKPFIGTAIGGIPDIIISEEYGLLCKPGNAKDLTEKIQLALNKRWNYEKIIQYSKKFSWSKIANDIIKIYEIT